MKKYLASVLLFAALAVVSCTKDPAPDDGGLTDVLDIVRHAESEYVVVHSPQDRNAASTFTGLVLSGTSAVIPKVSSDNAAVEKEILIGDTGRKESDDLLAEVGDYGYALAVCGSRFVMVWTDVKYLAEALNVLSTELLDNRTYCEKGRLQIPLDFRKVVKFDPPEPETTPTISDFLKAGEPFSIRPVYIGEVPPVGNCYVAQGAASDGTYAYFVLRNSGDTEAVVLKYTLEPFQFVSKSDIFNGGHCNDLTYYDPDRKVILAHGQSEGKILTKIDATTLKVEGNVDIPVGSGAITYNAKSARYAISQGGSSLHITRGDFSVIKSYSRTDNTGYTAQGMGSDDDFVYFPMSGKSDNLLVTYDWSGKWIKNITVPVSAESESMFCVNGKYYVCFYISKKGAALYQIIPEK